MAIGVGELREWLKGRDEADEVAIDDGGLALVIVGNDAYIEVGGMPDEEEDEREKSA
jgi:hypothetical protein